MAKRLLEKQARITTPMTRTWKRFHVSRSRSNAVTISDKRGQYFALKKPCSRRTQNSHPKSSSTTGDGRFSQSLFPLSSRKGGEWDRSRSWPPRVFPGSSCSDECSPRAGCISSERERRPGQYSSRPLRPLPERKGLSELEKSTASRSGRRAPIRFLLCRAAPAVPYPALR